jgi:hypothetical protein
MELSSGVNGLDQESEAGPGSAAARVGVLVTTGQMLDYQNRVALLVCDKQIILIKLAPVESTTYG